MELLPAVVVLGVWLAGAVVAAWALGVFRRESVVGRDRLAADESGWTLVIILVGGIFGAGFATAAALQLLDPPDNVAELLPGAVLFFAAFVLMVAGNLFLRRHGLVRVGMGVRNVPGGILLGVLGIVIAFPVVLWTSLATNLAWEWLELELPTPHPLLQQLGEAGDPEVIALLLLSAVVLAPLAEELIFRGMIQTALMRGFGGEHAGKGPRGFPVIQEGHPADALGVPGMGQYAVAPSVGLAALARRRWAAIVVTSLIFAGMHLHMSVAFGPPLFLLSVAMGYAYERTGNLWIPIVMHASFNGVQTVLFLATAG